MANTESEHKALSDRGYLPSFRADDPPEQPVDEKQALRAALDARGIAYDGRASVAKLRALMES